MTDTDTKAAEELSKLCQEIALLREQILAAGSALNRIERRLTLVFPTYERKTKRAPRKQGDVTTTTKTREELLALFEELLASTHSGGDSAFAAKIDTISIADLTALAFELGVTDRRKIGLKKAQAGIRSRVQESLLLGSGTPKS